MSYIHQDVDELGHIVLAPCEDLAFEYPAQLAGEGKLPRDSQDHALAAMGGDSRCCDMDVKSSKMSTRGADHDMPGVGSSENVSPGSNLRVYHRDIDLAPATSSSSAYEFRRGPWKEQESASRGTGPEVVADPLQCQPAPAAYQARQMQEELRQLCDGYGSGNTLFPSGSSVHSKMESSAVSDHDALSEWVVKDSFNVGVGSIVVSMPAGGSGQAESVHSSITPAATDEPSGPTQESATDSLHCRHTPCKRNGAPFRKACDRNKHEKRVHGEVKDRRHRCDSCGKRFNLPRELYRHQRAVHSDLPPSAVCHLCSALFKRSDHLHRHQETVHSDVPSTAVCHVCLADFKHRLTKLDKHLERDHPQVWAVIEASHEARSPSVSVTRSVRSSTTLASIDSPSTESFGLITPPPSLEGHRSDFF